MHTLSTLAFVSILFAVGTAQTLPLNNWSVPCTQGQCSYDLPAHTLTSGTIQLTGSSNGISDITEAAGWKIIDCDANSTSQTIRMICMNNNTDCNHVMQNGPVHKVVRLPENCGSMPFARVANHSIAEDQSIPPSIKRSLLFRRDNGTAQDLVHALTVDTNFAAANATATGNVSFAFQGVNVPGNNGTFNLTAPTSRKRQYISRPVIAARHRESTEALDRRFKIGGFNDTSSTNLPAVDVSVDKTLIDLKTTCDGVSLDVEVDINAKAQANIVVGATLAGQVIPPGISQFDVFVEMNGDIDATLNLKAAAEGSFDSGPVEIFQAGLPGLSVKDIFNIGPEFTVDAQVNGEVDLELDMSVDLAYSITNARAQFPSTQNEANGGNSNFKPADTNFALSADPSFSGSAQLQAHLIPKISLGFQVLGIAGVDAFVDLDASATLSLNGSAQATGGVGSAGKSGSASGQGCVDVSTGLDVNIGVEGNFFSLFDDSAQVSLFNKDFDIFSKCFAATSSKSNSTKSTASTSKASSTKSASSTSPVSSAKKASSTGTASSTKNASSTETVSSTKKSSSTGAVSSTNKSSSTSAVNSTKKAASTTASSSTGKLSSITNPTASSKPAASSAQSTSRAHRRNKLPFVKRGGLSCLTGGSGSGLISLAKQSIHGADVKLKA
ncbi:hypothetical protein EVG20_g3723 [Dentipellis fragilis]|uniref:DUF7223 domain-containing protein n=1 Tax=Dentipellis fragilis TaxID=205917 RepID=A0A4Y9Z2A2_9AGAM|nr:hypothetical protein EVG20_g3723 [Dentipellis fragilis]